MTCSKSLGVREVKFASGETVSAGSQSCKFGVTLHRAAR